MRVRGVLGVLVNTFSSVALPLGLTAVTARFVPWPPVIRLWRPRLLHLVTSACVLHKPHSNSDSKASNLFPIQQSETMELKWKDVAWPQASAKFAELPSNTTFLESSWCVHVFVCAVPALIDELEFSCFSIKGEFALDNGKSNEQHGTLRHESDPQPQ